MSLVGGSIAAQQPPAGAQSARPSPISQPELARRLGTSVDSLAKAGQFSGVVVLAKNGVPVFQHAYGMADRERGVANNLETAFNLGSINKVFTQIAILQLRAAGKLDPDSTLAKYWPDYPNKGVARRVTIRQLMRHTSGIGGDIFDSPTGGTRHDVRSLKDYLALFVNEPLQFEPGTSNAYSNAGYVVLGLLIERLSGQDYYAYVRDHILEPAGMTRTGSFFVDSLPLNTAIGYTTGSENAPPGAPPSEHAGTSRTG
jgi:CubicO group peptidase (beta-lactamase class C family)